MKQDSNFHHEKPVWAQLYIHFHHRQGTILPLGFKK